MEIKEYLYMFDFATNELITANNILSIKMRSVAKNDVRRWWRDRSLKTTFVAGGEIGR